jgi:hypothetical protein
MRDQKFQDCIDACLACAVACQHCATSCLHENDVAMLLHCVELERQCSIVCAATAQLLSIGGSHATHLCAECAEICRDCAQECERHAHMEHCKKCAAACRSCAEACEKMAGVHA